ncbi:unnamed protein product [Discula destructiva]
MLPQSQLIQGCWLEAERADRVAEGLDGLRTAINQSFHGYMIGVTDVIRQSAVHLRNLAAGSHTTRSRMPIVESHLNIILTCISRTLRDITTHYEDKTVSREIRWRKMYHDMLKEAGGLSLPQRFLMYNRFLTLLYYLLMRDRRFDPRQLEQLRTKIFDLRRLRGIPDPVQQQTTLPIAAAPSAMVVTSPSPAPHQQHHLIVPGPRPALVAVSRHEQRPHWCESVFQLFAARCDPGRAERTLLVMPSLVPGDDPHRPVARRVLMRQSINGSQFRIKFILKGLKGDNEEPCVVLRACDKDGGRGLVAWKGHNELVATRVEHMMVLSRWSESGSSYKEWLRLGFDDWEELVLFYTAFVVLKARNSSAGVAAAEYKIADEDTLFRAKIIDDDYDHVLRVARDRRTARMRLLTAAGDGELVRCPVWTAFMPARLRLVRTSEHRVLVRDIDLYVFCELYRESKMRQNLHGDFEINFIDERDADEFMSFGRPDLPALETPREQECIAGPSRSQ